MKDNTHNTQIVNNEIPFLKLTKRELELGTVMTEYEFISQGIDIEEAKDGMDFLLDRINRLPKTKGE